MKYKFTKENCPFSMVEIFLEKGETIDIEPQSMVYHSGGITLQAVMNGGDQNAGFFRRFFNAIGRSFSSGESFWVTRVTSSMGGGSIVIAPPTFGRVFELPIQVDHDQDGEPVESTSWFINDGAYLASDTHVNYKMIKQSISNSLFGVGGWWVMKTIAQRNGTILAHSFGDIAAVDLGRDDDDDDEENDRYNNNNNDDQEDSDDQEELYNNTPDKKRTSKKYSVQLLNSSTLTNRNNQQQTLGNEETKEEKEEPKKKNSYLKELIVDKKHVVAWESSLEYTIKSGGGLLGVRVGEGIVTHFTGKGRIYISTRNPSQFSNSIPHPSCQKSHS
ncbi:hypothetical protein DFA_02970 [Cavenderia fasciculata]|uniref:Altered inheritance of mitochondria protein 24, mitochondrial n=1 Tax=Cavenderia fasciculata TaxID=261658 RepID=F4PG92_CACFS|nr:uncharacterized protein DFA_02970 [Cavenderia fasciculata]EGG24726.1 hypothetical protein DFA_02970 [Cavenderia fasciculata]|eukprot:XP_004362577.1 hypothetical protein DFA_02970 [Cavenderia fasciculata]